MGLVYVCYDERLDPRQVKWPEVRASSELEEYIQVEGPVQQVITGANHTCALGIDGQLRCWGGGNKGQLGHGHDDIVFPAATASPVAFGEGIEPVSIAAGRLHTCAIVEGGELMCWGYNELGLLGLGHVADRNAPTEPVNLGPDTAKQVVAGDRFTCVLLDNEDEDIRCWGGGGVGKLGLANVEHIGDDELPISVDPIAYK